MKLKTTLFGNVYQFKDVKEVLAKANELRSGDVLAGVAAASSQERVAAKQVLSEMTVADIRNNPVIAYEDDCVTRLIQDGRFRADLYYRINTIELAIPPLRDRLDDIPDLCNFFVQKFNRENGSYTQGVEQEVLALMQQYTWPGNVRELEHVIERLCFLNPHSTIGIASCDFLMNKLSGDHTVSRPAAAFSSLQEQRSSAEIDLIRQTLRQTDGNKAKAARILGIDRTVLYRKLKKYHID